MEKNRQGALDKILSEITPEQQSRTDAKMQLAAKIADAMEVKGWNNKMLMEAMGKKNPSEITRWLSGTHNFTVETLIDLEHVLETKLLNLTDEEFTVQQLNISVVSYTGKPLPVSAIVNEPDKLYSYYDERMSLLEKVDHSVIHA